jgi:uncharacterized protein (DUF433 family)
MTEMRDWRSNELLAAPAYTPAEAARILSVGYTTLLYWIAGRDGRLPLIELAANKPRELSFINLLECHALKALTVRYGLRMPRVRGGLQKLKAITSKSPHPLLEERFKTDGTSLFIQESEERAPINLSRGGQMSLKSIVDTYLERISWNADGLVKYYPFVYKDQPDEPKVISMTPMISFGKPVIDGTGISTAVIASRFAAREDPRALAEEYGRSETEIWEAIRWEGEYRKAAG